MKRVTILSVLLLAACGEEAAPPPPSEPQVSAVEAIPAEPSIPAAEHGGLVVEVGARFIEVVAHDEGAIEAYPLDEELAPHLHGLLTAGVPGDDGHVHPIVMQWNPSAERYEGRMRGAQPLPGQLELKLYLDGEVSRGESNDLMIHGMSGVQQPPPVAEAPTAPRPAPRPTASRPTAAAQPTAPEAPTAEPTPSEPTPSEPAAAAPPTEEPAPVAVATPGSEPAGAGSSDGPPVAQPSGTDAPRVRVVLNQRVDRERPPRPTTTPRRRITIQPDN